MPHGRKRVFGIVELLGDFLVLLDGNNLLFSSLFPGMGKGFHSRGFDLLAYGN